MKKRTLKKLVTGMAIGLLFSTTAVFAATPHGFNYTLNPGQIEYTDLVSKEVTGDAKVEQQSLSSVIRYKVVNSLYNQRAASLTLTSTSTGYMSYYAGVSIGDSFKLKVENNTADNLGVIRNAKGRWTP